MNRHLDGTGTGHPTLACLDVLEAELDAITDAPAWSLNAEETTEVVIWLSADLAALQALAAPKHVPATEGAGAYDYEKPTPHKLGLAFLEHIERYPTDALPQQGGWPRPS